MDFLNEDFGVAMGFNDLLITRDGGAVWEEVTPDVENLNAENLTLVDENTFLIGSRSGVFVTQDGAQSWNRISESINNTWVSGIVYNSDNDILVSTLNGNLYRTDISGSSWDELLVTDGIDRIESTSPSKITIAVDGQKIMTSTDAGVTFEEVQLESDGDEFVDLYFYDENKGYAIQRFIDSLYLTKDGGVTWDKKKLPTATFWGGFSFYSDLEGYLVGGSAGIGRVLKTIDGGETWDEVLFLRSAFSAVSAPVPGEDLVWAGGTGGIIARFSLCNEAPSISALSVEEVCKNDTITASINFENVDVFQWTLPEGWLINGNDNTAQVQLLAGESGGTLSVIGLNSCGDETAPLTFNLGSPKENPIPEINLDEATLSTSASASTYQWYKDGEPIASANEQTYTATETGDYYVIVTYDNGCVSPISNVINVVISSIVTIGDETISLYPNPAQDYISLSNSLSGLQKVEIYNYLGQMVQSSGNQLNYNISKLPAGQYYLKLVTESDFATLPFSISR